jgi:hypothetical protein
MKIAAFIVTLFASSQAFAPSTSGRASTSLEAKPFFNRVFDMDLFAPVKDQNNYGARQGKNLKVGKLTDKSYIPAGLTKAQYENVRSADQKKKDQRYAKNVAKAGKFQDFTAWYAKRGTQENGGWLKSVTLGHNMAKTKYDWSGDKDKKLWANNVEK